MKKILLIFTILLFFIVPNFICAYSQNKPKDKHKNKDVEIIYLTKKEFLKKVWDYEKNPRQWIYEGKKPCIIDFFATWCGPCKLFGNTLQNIANEYKDKITCYKIDIDQQKELASVFGVRSVPSILFVPKNGQPQMAKGNIPKEQITKIISEVLLDQKVVNENNE